MQKFNKQTSMEKIGKENLKKFLYSLVLRNATTEFQADSTKSNRLPHRFLAPSMDSQLSIFTPKNKIPVCPHKHCWNLLLKLQIFTGLFLQLSFNSLPTSTHVLFSFTHFLIYLRDSPCTCLVLEIYFCAHISWVLCKSRKFMPGQPRYI